MASPITAVPPLATGPIAPGHPLGGSGRPFSEVLAQAAPGGAGGTPRSSVELAGAFVEDLEAGRQRLDQIIAQARSGKTFRPGELLALQAEVHRIGEEAALGQRLVEEGAGAMRRLWSMQL